ncbi:hypothetical protein [Polynucleobacter necessarius]|uniref:hypothetical protein n=1 Tax=Polynucleobacter necessarius TaxID=576610 RepID=UPI0039E48A62
MAVAMNAEEAHLSCGIEQSGAWLPRGACLNVFKASKHLLQDHERLTFCWNTQVI